jgi:hypothetical protein
LDSGLSELIARDRLDGNGNLAEPFRATLRSNNNVFKCRYHGAIGSAPLLRAGGAYRKPNTGRDKTNARCNHN